MQFFPIRTLEYLQLQLVDAFIAVLWEPLIQRTQLNFTHILDPEKLQKNKCLFFKSQNFEG